MVYNTSGVGTATENFLEGSQAVNVIPGYAAMDEMAFHVIESCEADFNAMMMECGVLELAYVEENHCEMIYEDGNGNKIKQLVDKAVNMFKEMWSKVQGLIQRALETFEKKAQEFREKVMKKIDTKFLKKRVDNLKADKIFGMSYNYKDIENYCGTVIGKINKADTVVDQAYALAASKAKNGETGYIDALDSALKKAVDDCIHNVTNNKSTNTAGIVKVLKDIIRGGGQTVQRNGAWVKENYDEIIKEVTDYPVTKRTLKKNYKDLQKGFNDAIKECKKANDGKMFEANAFTKAIKAYKDLRQIAVYAQQATISCLNEKQGFYRSVMFKLIGTKPVKESVSEASTMDGISSLFDWD